MERMFGGMVMAVAVAAATGFVSCIEDNDDYPGNRIEVNEAVLRITLKNSALGTRAPVTDAAQIANDANTEVNNFSVFVFNEDGYCWKGHFDVDHSTYTDDGTGLEVSAEGPVGTLAVNTSASKIYVIVNTGNKTTWYDSEADLMPESATIRPIELPSPEYNSYATGAIGISPVSFRPAGGVETAEVTVTCKFIAARITVKVDNRMINWGAPNSITIDQVEILNARGLSKPFPSAGEDSLIPVIDDDSYYAVRQYMSAESLSEFMYKPRKLSLSGALYDDYIYTASTEESPATTDYYYCVFENELANDPADMPTIVTLKGTSSDGENDIYFPVHLASYERFSPNPFTETSGILRGKSYDITIILTGDATTNDGGGTDDPTVPVEYTDVDVTLSVTDWTDVILPVGI